MGQDIFVAVLCVIAAAAGVWCWWVDNGSSRMDQRKNRDKETGEES